MVISKNNQKYIASNSFVVDNRSLNTSAALSICTILNTITSLNDEAIVAVFGTLDFNKIMLEHFSLDFPERAFKNDIVTFYSYVTVLPGDVVEIKVNGLKKQGTWEVPIVNGNFVFAARPGMSIAYSLS